MGNREKVKEIWWSAHVCCAILLFSFVLLCALQDQVEAKGMGRSNWSKNGGNGGGRTYLKKFKPRSVVYQRKIYNTKYNSNDDGNIGTSNNKFKKRLSDRTKIHPQTRSIVPQYITLGPPSQNETDAVTATETVLLSTTEVTAILNVTTTTTRTTPTRTTPSCEERKAGRAHNKNRRKQKKKKPASESKIET